MGIETETSMGIHILIICSLFIGSSFGVSKDDFEIFSDMLFEINHRLSISEEKLARTETELSSSRNDLKEALKELSATKQNLTAKAEDLERKVKALEDPPYIHTCGSQSHSLYSGMKTITYSGLLYCSSNTAGGGLDIDTGLFTAPHAGSYTVTWSLVVRGDGDPYDPPYVDIYIQHNGDNIKESRHVSQYTGDSGHVWDQGGRTLLISLSVGDTVALYCESCYAGIKYITFCVSLTTPADNTIV